MLPTYLGSANTTTPASRMSEIVQSERHGAVALLRLNRPEALNALSDAVLEALCVSLDAVEESGEARCVVLCGAGRAFAAGADVAGLRALAADEVLGGERGKRWQRLRAAQLPVIAAVHGWCLGGGCELALTCDIVIAADDARFGLPETGLGLIPGAGGTQRLPRIAGRSLALEMILAGRTLSAREALRAGICSRVVAPEALEREALALAARIAGRPALAVRLAREAVQVAFETPLETGLAEERRLFAEAFASADASEGMDAFVARRKPVWSHGG
jgi:enoyl-CoA hydratase/carnithine racemase